MRYSTPEELYEDLRTRFIAITEQHDTLFQNVEIHATELTPEEAIGKPGRTDYPIIEGKDRMLQAVYNGSKGQVFTDSPASFTGSVSDILRMDIVHDRHARSLFIAVMNAVMRSLSLTDGTVHCRNNGMENCAVTFARKLEKQYGNGNICQIGFQPALVATLSRKFRLRVADLNPQNIGMLKDGVKIEDGSDPQPLIEWADVILCTGSTLANGTILNFLNTDKDVIFYGTTIAGAASLLNLKRMCFESQ